MTRARFAALTFLPLALASFSRATDVYIGVAGSKEGARTTALGLPPFEAEDPHRSEDAELGRKARETVRADLLFSRYFRILEEAPAADTPAAALKDEWRRRGAGFLLQTRASQTADQVSFTVRLTDLGSGEAIFERYYRQSVAYWKNAAHKISDDLTRQLTGKAGIAQSQIAFVNDAAGTKEIYVADYDGSAPRRATADRSINLLPRWSPDKRSIAFTSYKDGNPDLFLLDLQSGSARVLSDRQGLNLAGGFSPDGRKIAVTLSRQKNPNIYILSVDDGSERKVTDHFGVDASATFSPDGESIAFVSDRSGNPQVHILELATGRIHRLTRLNWCDAPTWSPNGDWVAFSGRANPKDRMDIFLVDVAGSRLIQLTHGEGSNEDPAWSPDGRFLAFTSTRAGRRQIFLMDADGSAPHPLADMPGNSSTPNWSP